MVEKRSELCGKFYRFSPKNNRIENSLLRLAQKLFPLFLSLCVEKHSMMDKKMLNVKSFEQQQNCSINYHMNRSDPP